MKTAKLFTAAILILLAFILSTTPSCTTQKVEKFVVKKNHHYHTNYLKMRRIPFTQRTFTFAFMFDSSVVYNLHNVNQGDWNKLLGYSYKFADPHWNSARFTWRWDTLNKVIEIGAYSYVDGVKHSQVIGYALPNKIYTAELQDRDRAFVYRYNGNVVYYPKNVWDEKKYWQFFYFGGNEKAPHNIRVYIWRNKQ